MTAITMKSDDQKDAEFEVESFRRDLGPFVAATERTRLPMVFTDAKDHPIIFADDSFLAMTGEASLDYCAAGVIWEVAMPLDPAMFQ